MYEICMRFRCKTCPKLLDCEEKKGKKYKDRRLMYRPFENLPKILREKGIKVKWL